MATLYDGLPVFTAVAGNSALAADQNTIQDKLILGLQARYWHIQPTMGEADSSSTWTYSVSTHAWRDTTPTSGGYMAYPIYLPSGAQINEAAVWIKGAGAGQTGGAITLYSFTQSTGANASVSVMSGANPWQTLTVNKVESTGLTSDVDDDVSYFILIQNATGGPAVANNNVYGARVKWMFHKGT